MICHLGTGASRTPRAVALACLSLSRLCPLVAPPSRRRRARRRSSSPPPASRRRSSRSTRRRRRHRRRDASATRAPIRSRTCCAAPPACSSSRNGGPGQSSGFFIRGAGTSSTVVLVDGVRVGSATLGQAEFEALSLAQIDRIEVLRGPASSLYGADARRRRGPDLHAARRGRAARRRRARRSAATTRARATLGASGAQGAFDYARRRSAREKSAASRRSARRRRSAHFNPDDDGFSRESGSAAPRLHAGAGPSHRRAACSRRRLQRAVRLRPSSPPTFNPDPSPDFRNHLKTRVASLDYRGAVTSSWTTTRAARRTASTT